jgi:hypothetical protein
MSARSTRNAARYPSAYGDQVCEIEYTDTDAYGQSCAENGDRILIVILRPGRAPRRQRGLSRRALLTACQLDG